MITRSYQNEQKDTKQKSPLTRMTTQILIWILIKHKKSTKSELFSKTENRNEGHCERKRKPVQASTIYDCGGNTPSYQQKHSFNLCAKLRVKLTLNSCIILALGYMKSNTHLPYQQHFWVRDGHQVCNLSELIPFVTILQQQHKQAKLLPNSAVNLELDSMDWD